MFDLDDKSQDPCIMVMPIGKYKYNHLPMDLICAPDFAQQVMKEALWDIEGREFLN